MLGLSDVFASKEPSRQRTTFQASPVGTTNSSVEWANQQRFKKRIRSRKLDGIGIMILANNSGDPNNVQDIIRRSLDLNFMKGSAANYTWQLNARLSNK
jgi:hypothetical protein